jgi:hypothetical protein
LDNILKLKREVEDIEFELDNINVNEEIGEEK